MAELSSVPSFLSQFLTVNKTTLVIFCVYKAEPMLRITICDALDGGRGVWCWREKYLINVVAETCSILAGDG